MCGVVGGQPAPVFRGQGRIHTALALSCRTTLCAHTCTLCIYMYIHVHMYMYMYPHVHYVHCILILHTVGPVLNAWFNDCVLHTL